MKREPRDIPILFSTPMIRALLAGDKTMTRRMAWRWPKSFGDCRPIVGKVEQCGEPTTWQKVKPGDRLWVRESFAYKATGVYFQTDVDGTVKHAWRPSIHMPREHSRITLIVTATKIEPIQAITDREAWQEGIKALGPSSYTPRNTFCALWQSLHGHEGWHDNPPVVALSFTVHQHNIDAMPKAA